MAPHVSEVSVRIGELAATTGASVRSLRYYEVQGLLESQRSPHGQRVYAAAAIDRVHFIRRLLSARLTTKTIAALLPCVDDPSATNYETAGGRLRTERALLDQHIAELTRTRDTLDEVIATNEHCKEAWELTGVALTTPPHRVGTPKPASPSELRVDRGTRRP
jgi:DNA-binding transcriptional MerR regulator